MLLRPARLSDSIKIYKWRNNKLSREMSVNQKYISWNSHSAWYKKSLQDQNMITFIGQITANLQSHNLKTLNGLIDVGIVRFQYDKTKSCNELSFIIDPLYRKKNLAKSLTKLGIKTIQEMFPDSIVSTIVRNENSASLTILTSLGFNVVEKTPEFTYLHLTTT